MNKKMITILAACLLMALTVSAQEQLQNRGMNLLSMPGLPDGLRQGPYSLNNLLENTKVMKELKMTDEQLAKYKEAKKQFDETFGKYIKNINEKKNQAKALDNREEFIKLNANYSEDVDNFSQRFDENISRRILDKERLKRLKEIRLQAEGFGIFNRQEIQENLGLSQEQLAEINRISRDGITKYRASANLPANTKRAKVGENTTESKEFEKNIKLTQTRMIVMRTTIMQDIERTLIKAQKAKLKNILGEPFDFFGNNTENEKSEKHK